MLFFICFETFSSFFHVLVYHLSARHDFSTFFLCCSLDFAKAMCVFERREENHEKSGNIEAEFLASGKKRIFQEGKRKFATGVRKVDACRRKKKRTKTTSTKRRKNILARKNGKAFLWVGRVGFVLTAIIVLKLFDEMILTLI